MFCVARKGRNHSSRASYLEGPSVFPDPRDDYAKNTLFCGGKSRAKVRFGDNSRRNNYGEQPENFDYENIIDD